MSKTKYIKVPVSERLPKENLNVICIDQFDNVYEGFIVTKGIWQIYSPHDNGNIIFWFEEVPDIECELLEFLIKIKKEWEQNDLKYGGENYHMQELEQLLNELNKQ
jgi:hypothetical protein